MTPALDLCLFPRPLRLHLCGIQRPHTPTRKKITRPTQGTPMLYVPEVPPRRPSWYSFISLAFPPNELRDGWHECQGVWQPGGLRFQVPWAELWKLFCAEHVGNQRPFLPASGPGAEAHSFSSSKVCDPGEGIPSPHL